MDEKKIPYMEFADGQLQYPIGTSPISGLHSFNRRKSKEQFYLLRFYDKNVYCQSLPEIEKMPINGEPEVVQGSLKN